MNGTITGTGRMKYRGIVFKKDKCFINGYSSVEHRITVYRIHHRKWLASVDIGDNEDAEAFARSMRSAIDLALDEADKKITSEIKYFEAERAKIRRIRWTGA